MRLHHLSVTAFGPFADTQSVDFDELNDAGLFLLTGPTGAGKSSLLDAVCFALYGSVPGARGTKTLRSQHAPDEVAPEVVLDFSVRGRRFVVRRRPEWSRRKRRGDGFVTEKASASLTETTDGEEHFHTARAAEVGVLLGDLLGMNASQFVQVALLPQGEFQTFLRASSQDRHAVLQHLFRTDRFSRIEDWVHEHSRDLRQRAVGDEQLVQRLVDGIADRAAVPVPDDLQGDALATATDGQRPVAWAEALLAEATAAAARARADHDGASSRLQAARDAHALAVRRQERLDRVEAARRTLEALADGEETAAQARERLAADDRAAAVRPLLRLADEATTTVAATATARDRAVAGLRLDDAPDRDALVSLADRARDAAGLAEALRPRAVEAEAAGRALTEARASLAAAEQRRSDAEDKAATLPLANAEAEQRWRAATADAARLDGLAAVARQARERRDAVLAVPAAEAAATRAADAHRGAHDQELTAREHRQELAARRLAGMAAELAGRLSDGDACQVCGATEHPAPASPAADAVTEADQAAADAAVEARGRALADAAERRQLAEQEAERLRSAAGGLTAAEAEAVVREAAEAHDGARRSADGLDAATRRVATLRDELDHLAADRAEAATDVARLREVVEGHERTLAAVGRELRDAGLTEDHGGAAGDSPVGRAVARLDEQVRALRVRADRARVALAAHDEAAAAVARRHDLLTEATDTAAAVGFPDLPTARAAGLAAGERAQLQAALDDRARTADRARAVLEEASDADDLGDDEDQPDLFSELPEQRPAALAARVAAAEHDAAEAARLGHLAEERRAALAGLVERLRPAVASWAPLREQSSRAESMSRLVRGMGQDNQLQMRLSAYVLATRLDQVVAAANERLAQLRDRRYLLQRTGRAASRRSQAGLGLEVVDQWTGDTRDPATLSGGETFVVSLSLALGLADVVTQEAGGTEIETLFVDEGFGTLDADTLDDVMDRLDGLRAGGRTVGVVSHVSELRNRIPTQVHVTKGRRGSTVDVATLVG